MLSVSLERSVRGDCDNLPSDLLLVENFWENTAGGLSGQPQRAAKMLSHGDRLQVQKVESRMTLRYLGHEGHGWSWVGKKNVAAEFKQAQDGAILLFSLQLLERPGQVATCSKHGGTARSVVPVGSSVKRHAPGLG